MVEVVVALPSTAVLLVLWFDIKNTEQGAIYTYALKTCSSSRS
jgi:hypothetical protein